MLVLVLVRVQVQVLGQVLVLWKGAGLQWMPLEGALSLDALKATAMGRRNQSAAAHFYPHHFPRAKC